MTDHALAAQQAAEAHLEACYAALNDSELEPVEEPETAAPFCGCFTCEVREVLQAAYPHLRAMWEEDQ